MSRRKVDSGGEGGMRKGGKSAKEETVPGNGRARAERGAPLDIVVFAIYQWVWYLQLQCRHRCAPHMAPLGLLIFYPGKSGS